MNTPTVELNSLWEMSDNRTLFRVDEIDPANMLYVGALTVVQDRRVTIIRDSEISFECLAADFHPATSDALKLQALVFLDYFDDAFLNGEAKPAELIEQGRTLANDRMRTAISASLLVGVIVGALAPSMAWYVQLVVAFASVYLLCRLFWYERA